MNDDGHKRLRIAEHVLPGHPDKLADAIADALVQEAFRRERRALAGVEVAVHRDVVFVDGRIACRGARDIDVEGIVRGIYESAGHGGPWEPRPGTLRVITDLDLGSLVPGESRFREYADDQVISTGYATTRNAAGLPVEQLLSWSLARALAELRSSRPDLRLGPDGKVLACVEEDLGTGGVSLAWLSLSLQCAGDGDERRAVVEETCRRVAADVLGADPVGPERPRLRLNLNGAGDFTVGGPMGDNGLSGKKLVADAYGPRVPIGGGAMSGKDVYKADRAGAILARRAALLACRRHGFREALVTLAVQPGERAFRVLDACAPDGRAFPADVQRQLAPAPCRLADFGDAVPADLDFVELARWGHFTPHSEAERLVEGSPADATQRTGAGAPAGA